ncbi:pentapeptide repeat-containing protein [Paenibacillus soyae]|uniref:Pentapeptide repeat-containing protein n=1 Tax=Paenibacillus soyae TaxID=2969249 RepID=A0A9X2MVI2_9BACL|nr:pentapeptide repeat-containing protein [Paenibacillus soyae]MCR2806628.1 pentapeptide repeat-containing protein [Paenibacillus soyae]
MVHRLKADCDSCFGLCCVALPFAASVDFAVDKAAGQACANLKDDFRCGVHGNLRTIGYKGCTVFDCFGAGQYLSQVTFGGRDWRRHKESAEAMFGALPVMRQLHELLWYVEEALSLSVTEPIHENLREALEETERLARLDGDSLLKLDIVPHRANVNELLMRTSELVREETLRGLKGGGRRKAYGRGANLMGAKLKNADLRGANLRGAYLIAANLSGADLRGADLIGADFRDADVTGADLSGSLFLTQFQLNAAKGDAATKIPATLARPDHWTIKK